MNYGSVNIITIAITFIIVLLYVISPEVVIVTV